MDCVETAYNLSSDFFRPIKKEEIIKTFQTLKTLIN